MDLKDFKFSERLKSARKATGLSQAELAEKLKISQDTVSAWECGIRYPKCDKFFELAKILDCTVDDLIHLDA